MSVCNVVGAIRCGSVSHTEAVWAPPLVEAMEGLAVGRDNRKAHAIWPWGIAVELFFRHF